MFGITIAHIALVLGLPFTSIVVFVAAITASPRLYSQSALAIATRIGSIVDGYTIPGDGDVSARTRR